MVLMKNPQMAKQVIGAFPIQQPHSFREVRIGMKIPIHGLVKAAQAKEIVARRQLKIPRSVKQKKSLETTVGNGFGNRGLIVHQPISQQVKIILWFAARQCRPDALRNIEPWHLIKAVRLIL